MGSETWSWVEAVCKTSEQSEKVNEWSSLGKNYGNLTLKWPSARCLIPVWYRKAAYLQETGDDCGSSELPSVVTCVTLSVIAGSRTGSDPWWETMLRYTEDSCSWIFLVVMLQLFTCEYNGIISVLFACWCCNILHKPWCDSWAETLYIPCVSY